MRDISASLPFGAPGARRTAPAGRTALRLSLAGAALLALASCGWDADLRSSNGLNTTSAARAATASRPQPDAQGIITYPNYQVAVARRGDTVVTVANRIGVDPAKLASYNAIAQGTTLHAGEILALPSGMTASAAPESYGTAGTGDYQTAPTTTTTGSGSDEVDITSLASSALDRASATQGSTGQSATASAPSYSTPTTAPASSVAPLARKQASGQEPIRHKVQRGETAFTIARYYNVSPKALAEWNGLSADMSVREGQYLLIPPKTGSSSSTGSNAPGTQSQTPEPPSASQPLPQEVPPAASTPVDTSAAPDLGASRTAAARSQLAMPVAGKIVRPYVKKKNDGIDISAPAGTPVKAAEAGTVAAITKDTEQVPIMVLRLDNGLLAVYANVTGISVQKGDSVRRGQTIAKLRSGSDNALHFEVRKGFDSVDPMPYLE